ncbi:MAG: CidA/LrgA family protein [Rikenellaceae bacterium]|nr:CidA/LrgA family protein [Rikenellaceae bacterium]
MDSKEVKKTVSFFLDNMILFFVPAGVGIITSYDILGKHIWAILAACTISTVLVVASVGLLFQFLDKKKRNE